MKRILTVTMTGALIIGAFGQNLIRNGTFEDEKSNIRSECRANGGRISLITEELTWNKCGKLEIDKIGRDKDGNETVSAGVWIGGDGKTGGFSCKPDTVYRYQLQVKGTADNFGISALQWDKEAGLWKYKLIKAVPGEAKTQAEWTTYTGTFQTGPDAVSAALYIQLWWNTKYGPQKFKVGDYILFDNVVVEEKKNPLDDESTKEKAVKTTKAAAIGETRDKIAVDGKLDEKAWDSAMAFDDFVLFSRRGKTGASGGTSVKMLSDDQNLYLGVVCREPEKIHAVIKSDGTKKIWDDDVLEFFFVNPERPGAYRQFCISAGGGRYTGDSSGENRDYAAWQGAVSVATGEWRAELAIPLSLLGYSAVNGNELKFNIARQRKNCSEYWSWNKVRRLPEIADYGVAVFGGYGHGITREQYEKRAAEKATAELKTKYAALKNRKVIAAPVRITANFTVPFMPDEVFEPVEKIELMAAVNEIKPLALAVANPGDKATDYRVTLEHEHQMKFNGKYGLANFPAEKITLRQAVRVRDSITAGGELFDPLPKVNQASILTVPAKEAGLLWFDFDTTGIKPDVYCGVIRVVPLNSPGQFIQKGKAYHSREYEGDMLEIPVTLNVRDIVLSTEPARARSFFSSFYNDSIFKAGIEAGQREFGINTYSFNFPLEKDGKFIPEAPEAQKSLNELKRMAAAVGIKPKIMIIYSGYNVFHNMYGKQSSKYWGEWLKTLDYFMVKNGFSNSDYNLEIYDEPRPEVLETLLNAAFEAKNAVPDLRLAVTLGAHVPEVAMLEKCSPYINEWIVWSRSYFNLPDHLEFFRNERNKGKKVSHYTCDTNPRSPLHGNHRYNAWFGEHYRLDADHFYQLLAVINSPGGTDWLAPTGGELLLLSFGEVVPTLRYMALRQGTTDIKYLDKLRSLKHPEADKFLETATQRMIDNLHDLDMPDKIREEAATLILKLQ